MMQLDVYLEAVADPVGTLSRADDGEISFAYRNDDLPHPISQSLPVSKGKFGDAETRGFFDNLLFENPIRDQVMQRYGIEWTDTVGLLFHLGRDSPGAISVVPAGETPGKRPGDLNADYDPLTQGKLEEIMLSLRDRCRMPDETADPSPLAGVQGKIAITVLPDGDYALPRPGTGAPTTHILKVPPANNLRLVEHENMLMETATTLLDHPVAKTRIIGDNRLPGLLVTRYDRRVQDGMVHRLHQEDFCQALGLGPYLKYQRNGSGESAFSARRVGQLLTACDVPAKARLAFLEGTVTSLLLGNTDNHAKNHGLLYTCERADRPKLAPFYDIVPTLVDYTVTHQLPFEIGNARMTDEITPDDFRDFVKALGMRDFTAPMRHRMATLITSVVQLIDEMNGLDRKRLGDVMAMQARSLANAIEVPIDVPERDLVIINRP